MSETTDNTNEKEQDLCECPMGSGKFGMKPGVMNGICCRCGKPISKDFVDTTKK